MAAIRSAGLPLVQHPVCVYILGLKGLTKIFEIHPRLILVIIVPNEKLDVFSVRKDPILLKAVSQLCRAERAHTVPVDHSKRICKVEIRLLCKLNLALFELRLDLVLLAQKTE